MRPVGIDGMPCAQDAVPKKNKYVEDLARADVRADARLNRQEGAAVCQTDGAARSFLSFAITELPFATSF
jgi:hypothetical protein